MRADAAPSTPTLRGWQRRALVKYLSAQPRDFLAVATPGSGKTTFALRIVAELLAHGDGPVLVTRASDDQLKAAVAAHGEGVRRGTAMLWRRPAPWRSGRPLIIAAGTADTGIQAVATCVESSGKCSSSWCHGVRPQPGSLDSALSW